MLVSIIRKIIKKLLQAYYTPQKFYRIPFGANRSKFFQYDNSVNIDMMLGLHEPNTFEVMRQVIKPGMVAVDLGAHYGYFSIFISDLVTSTGAVYSFEPFPMSFRTLCETIETNELSNIVAVQKAVSNENGTASFFLSRTPYMASLNPNWAGLSEGEIEVETIRLDTFFESNKCAVDFIKMDIEGGGVYALEGIHSLILKFKPILLLESHTPEEDKAIGKALQLIKYEVFRVGSRIPITDLNADYRNADGVYGTVIGIPEEKLADFNNLSPNKFQQWRLGQRQ